MIGILEMENENLSDDEMRNMLKQDIRLQSMSREELIEEIKARGLNQPESGIQSLEIHPLSSLAKAAASPAEAQLKEFQGTLPWEWFLMLGLFILMIMGAGSILAP